MVRGLAASSMMPPGLLGLVNLMVRSDSAETVTGAGHVAQVGALAYTAEWGMAAAGLAAQWGHNMAYTVVVADSAASAAAAGHHVVASDVVAMTVDSDERDADTPYWVHCECSLTVAQVACL